MNYTIRPLSMTRVAKDKALSTLWLAHGHRIPRGPFDKGLLGVYKDEALCTAIPFRTQEKGFGAPDFYQIACDLFCFRATVGLDPAALTRSLLSLSLPSGRMLVLLPFQCPGFSCVHRLENPFIEMAGFEPEGFLRARSWLSRQRKKWAGFKFSFSGFQFGRDHEILDFYTEHHAARFNRPAGDVATRLADVRRYQARQRHVAVLRSEKKLIAVWLALLNASRELFLWNAAIHAGFLRCAPGNALTYQLLCYVKQRRIADRVYFGPIAPSDACSYKSRWCDQVRTSYLYRI